MLVQYTHDYCNFCLHLVYIQETLLKQQLLINPQTSKGGGGSNGPP